MFKGRLLRQEAINLDGDQKLGGIANAKEATCIGLPTAAVPEKDKFIPDEENLTLKLSQRNRVNTQSPISEISNSLNRDKREKRVIFSKRRIHSSPLNISKTESFNVTRRVHSEDGFGFGHENIGGKGHSADNAREPRTLEEAAKEFLLNCHNKRTDSRVNEETCKSYCGKRLDKRLLDAESGCANLKASGDVTKLPVASKRRVTAFKGRKFLSVSTELY